MHEIEKGERESGLMALKKMHRKCSFGQILFDGSRPPNAKSWWGGNFLMMKGETIPANDDTGAAMQPIVQLACDEIPISNSVVDEYSIVSLWIDLTANMNSLVLDPKTYEIRAYRGSDDLQPVSNPSPSRNQLPKFPIHWQPAIDEQPSWYDVFDLVPESLKTHPNSDWILKNEHAINAFEHRLRSQVKVGGWPNWFQGANWPKIGDYAFQIDSTTSGGLVMPNGGSLFVFRTSAGWELRLDYL